MKIIINEKTVLLQGIESMWYDESIKALVVRTISGDEHRKAMESKDKAEDQIDKIISSMAFGTTV